MKDNCFWSVFWEAPRAFTFLVVARDWVGMGDISEWEYEKGLKTNNK